MKKQSICRVNLECPNSPCPNYFTCKDLGLSWEIPYYRNNEGLFVKKWGWRRDWTAQAKCFDQPMNQCPINGAECGYYKIVSDSCYSSEDDDYSNYHSHNALMNERMIEAWKEYGFCAAVDIKSKPIDPICYTEEEIDSIPF